MRRCIGLFVALFIVHGAASSGRAQGIIPSTAGPINSSMAGASTAAPIEFGGSYWNPAIISGLSEQEVLLSGGVVLPSIGLQSTIPANSIFGRFPATTRSGFAASSSGVSAAIASGFSFRLEDQSPLTLGLGIFGIAGGGVNFAGDSSVPVLAPHNPPATFGVGPIYSNLSLLSINPMASYQATEKLAVAVGPMISSGTANFAPAFFAPTTAGKGLLTFPYATNSHPFWGAGFQIGTLYEINDDWNIGFSYKSPIWQQKWKYNAAYPNGANRQIGVQASLPEMFSWGVAYKGIENALIDIDLRYIDYANAQLFGQSVRNGGLGWKSVFAVATGAQYALTEKLTLRAGYLYNTNPVPNPVTLFNVQAPAISQHTLSLGSSYALTENITISAAWVHAFTNSIEGPILQIPGASIRSTVQVESILMGVNMAIGGRKKKPATTAPVVIEEPTDTADRPTAL